MVTGSWRISSVACLKVTLFRSRIAIVHEKVSQASLTFGRRWGFLRVSCTSSTAQGGGGSFKNRKPIGEIDCCESPMTEQKH